MVQRGLLLVAGMQQFLVVLQPRSAQRSVAQHTMFTPSPLMPIWFAPQRDLWMSSCSVVAERRVQLMVVLVCNAQAVVAVAGCLRRQFIWLLGQQRSKLVLVVRQVVAVWVAVSLVLTLRVAEPTEV
jgi:hypothetical protein